MTVSLKTNLFSLCILLVSSLTAQDQGYYRSPSISGNTIVFTAEGDLWKHDIVSGTTNRLTTNHGVEIDANISPDGKWIAFLAQYEGPNEVYIISMDGGVAKRMTYDENRPSIHGWTEDGKLLYSTMINATLPNAQLFHLNVQTLEQKQVPLAQADQAVYAPNGDLYFTKNRKQPSHNKRYKGGTIQHIYKYDGENEAVNLTSDFDGTSKNPMFFDGRIYFLSDRDGSMNIWSMVLDGNDKKQHTHTIEWDYYEADMDNGRIAFQRGADL